MKATQCLFGARMAVAATAALYRPSPSTTAHSLLLLSVLSLRHHSPALLPPRIIPTTTLPHSHSRGYAFQRVAKVQPDRLPQNLEITDSQVLVIEPDGSLSGPHDPRVIVSRLDLHKYVLRMIDHAILPPPPPPPGTPPPPIIDPSLPPDPNAPPPPPPPPTPRPALCRIVDKAQEYQAKKAAKLVKREEKEQGKGKKRLKEIEISWTIGGHDLERKIRQAIRFMQKGMKVEIIIAKKKGAKEGDAQDKKDKAMLEKIYEMVAQVPGTSVARDADGQPGKTMRLYFAGNILQPGEGGEEHEGGREAEEDSDGDDDSDAPER